MINPIASAADQRSLVEWNSTAVRYPTDCFVTDLFSQQARSQPAAVALECHGATLSYGELERRSDELADLLCERYGVGPERVVGLLVERSFDMIVGLLGILKAGGAYLPLDTGCPSERLSYMLENAGANLVVSQSVTAKMVPRGVQHVLVLDVPDRLTAIKHPAAMPRNALDAGNLAYIIYTSGSTGAPKGVMIPHRAFTNHMLWMRDAFPLHHDDILLQKTPLSFDASVWEVFAPLICGAKLVLAKPNGHKDPAYLAAVVRDSNVTTLQLVPSMLRLFLAEPAMDQCQSLRNVFSGGEALTVELSQLFFERTSAGLHNLYGPTETCIQVIVHSCIRSDESVGPTVPIGRPIANSEAYVLGEELEQIPIGVAGELYIGGAPLARGYCNREDLTRESFIPNPFGPPGSRMYRTGDRVRHRPDGSLEFLGRADQQVKIRGYRVELGEVEAVLMKHCSVREAVVTVLDDHTGSRKLIAYVVPRGGDCSAFVAELRRSLESKFPEYMIPSRFVQVAGLPRLTSGKIDRNALLAPTAEIREMHDFEPLSPAQSVLTALWEEVLDVRHIVPSDGFFSLGGTSIQLLYVLSEANQRFGISKGVDELSATVTLAEMASLFEAVAAADAEFPAQTDRCSTKTLA